MTERNTLADGRDGEAMEIVGSLGLPYHYRLPPDAQGVVDAAATGCPKAFAAYAAMLLELSALHELNDKETCALVEPVAALAMVNGGPDEQVFMARLVRRLADALRDDPGPLSSLDEARKVASWWQAVALFEALARQGHEQAKAELHELLEQMAADDVAQAADARRRFQDAGLIG